MAAAQDVIDILRINEGYLEALGGSHSRLFTGTVRYVDASQSDDTGDGLSPSTAKKTIQAAETVSNAGDAITIKQGTYTENVTVNQAGIELWAEIGAIIVGTLTVSADSCRVEGLIISPSGAVGLALTGNRCIVTDTMVVGTPTTAFDIDGYQNIIRDCKAIGYTVTAFDVANYNTHLFRCIADGSGGATRGFYFSHADADDNTVENCISLENTTSSYHFVAGTSGSMIIRCSSGAEDGRWMDDSEANVWEDFHFADYTEEINILSIGGGGGTVSYNLYQITGIIKVLSIEGVIDTTLTGTNTNCYMDIYSTNGSDVISKNTTLAIGAALKGSLLARLDKSDKILSFSDANQGYLVDEIDTKKEGFRVGEDRTGGAHVDTFIRFTHTGAAACTGEIHWYCKWIPVSDDGWLAAV